MVVKGRKRPRDGGDYYYSTSADMSSPDATKNIVATPVQPSFGENSTSSSHAQYQRRRRADEVEKLSKTECLYTTSLQTPYGGNTQATGTMFTVLPRATLEVLTFEFDSNNNTGDETLPVVVYYKEGDFSGTTSDPRQWTQLAETTARRVPGDGPGWIVPSSEFTGITLAEGTMYSFYIHVQTGQDVLRMRSADNLIGDIFYTDSLELLSVQTGVALDGAFPSTFSELTQFSGRLHYKTTQQCDTVRTSTVVELEFAVNENPEEEVMEALSEAVRKSIEAVVILDVDLIQFDKYHGLEIVGVESAFMGRSEEKCPAEFKSCSNIYTRVTFLHLPTISSGQIQLQVFQNDDRIAESVITQSDYETEYVGPPVLSMDFVVTLIGVPTGSRMNSLQRRYFESITTEFLQQASTEVAIYTAEAKEEVTADGSAARRRLSIASQPMRLRGSMKQQRKLQDLGSLQVVTTVFGASPSTGAFREAVLEGISLGRDAYSSTLASQQLRPGEINEGNSGDMFASVAGATVMMKPDNFGGGSGGSNVGSSSDSVESDVNPVWVAICSIGIFLSIGWLIFRVYKDFFAPPPDDADTKDPKGISDTERNGLLSFFSNHDRSMPMLGDSKSDHVRTSRPRSSPDLMMSHSAHPRASQSTPSSGKHLLEGGPRNMAGQNGRGVRPSRSMPLDLMARPKHIDEEENDDDSEDEEDDSFIELKPPAPMHTKSAPLSKVHRIDPEADKDQENEENEMISLKPPATKSAPVKVVKSKKKKDALKNSSSDTSALEKSNHSVNSAPDIMSGAPRKPERKVSKIPKLQPNDPSNEGLKSSNHSIRSAPDLVKRQPTKKKVPAKKTTCLGKKKPNTDDNSVASGQSIRSAPELKVKKKLQSTTPPVVKRPPDDSDDKSIASNAKSLPDLGAKRRVYEDFDSSSSEESASSEESDIEAIGLVKPFSQTRKDGSTKPKSLPNLSSHASPEDTESSEESAFDDFVSSLIVKTAGEAASSTPTTEQPKLTQQHPGDNIPKVDGNTKTLEVPVTEDTAINSKSVSKDGNKKAKKVKGKASKKKKETSKASSNKDSVDTETTSSTTKVKKKTKKKKKIPKTTTTSKTKDEERSLEEVKKAEDIELKDTEQSSVDKTPKTETSSISTGKSDKMISLRQMVAASSDEDSSNSSTHDDEEDDEYRPIRSLRFRSKATVENKEDVDDDDADSAVSSITASFHSSKARSNLATPTGRTNATYPVGLKVRNRLSSLQAATALAQATKTTEEAPGTIPNMENDTSESQRKEEDKAAEFREYLKDTTQSVPRLSLDVMKPSHLRESNDMRDDEDGNFECKLAIGKGLVKSDSGDLKVKMDWYKQPVGKTTGISSGLMSPMRTDLMSKKSISKPTSMNPTAPSTGISPRLQMKPSRISKDVPPRGVKRTSSAEGLLPMRAANLRKPDRGVRRAKSNEGLNPISTVCVPERGVRRARSNEGFKPITRTLSSEALKLREIANSAPRRSSSIERLQPLSSDHPANRDTIRGHLKRTLSNESLSRNSSHSHEKPKRWGDLVRTYSSEKLVPASMGDEDRRSQLRRNASDERRGAIASHLKDILGGDDDED